jgi:ubiquinone/menaquinone biosynthesis C-methylase UbiE
MSEHPHSPQAKQMADESMVRNLAAQAEAIWPQEAPIFRRQTISTSGRVLDIGCGTGEISARLLELFPGTSLVGVDLDQSHLSRAAQACARFPGRASFHEDDALALSEPSGQFDLAVSRHLLQAVPDAGRALDEMLRVLKPGGRLHAIAEDYGMLWCHPTATDSDDFWQRLPQLFGKAVGCDNHIGRKLFTLLTDRGCTDIAVDYAVIDTLRVPRETFARIWEAWRDGYTDPIAEATGLSANDLRAHWNEMIACVRDRRGYALWQVPIWTARKPS